MRLDVSNRGALWAMMALGVALPSANSQQPAPPRVVATVNEEPLYLAEVHRYLQRLPTTNQENIKESEPIGLRAIVQRQLVLEQLQRMKFVAKPAVEQQLERRRAILAERNELLETVCAEQGITVDALRRSIAWNIAWPAYLSKQLDARRLRRYFEKHRSDFDGGHRDVAHILWTLRDDDEPERRSEILETAREVWQQIRDEELTFADAAKQYSEGPSAATGGTLGSITREGPMTRAFTESAFDLEEGEISGPVWDPFGLHLIKCLNIEAGKKQFKQVRNEVEAAARSYLFEALAKRASRNASVEYTDVIAMPEE